jgi:hypothetical protein
MLVLTQLASFFYDDESIDRGSSSMIDGWMCVRL